MPPPLTSALSEPPPPAGSSPRLVEAGTFITHDGELLVLLQLTNRHGSSVRYAIYVKNAAAPDSPKGADWMATNAAIEAVAAVPPNVGVEDQDRIAEAVVSQLQVAGYLGPNPSWRAARLG